MTETGQTIAERFVLSRFVSSGGMGSIFEGWDLETSERVAIKLQLVDASNERFVREAELLKGLVHPNIVRYIAHGILPNGSQFLAMEWLEGEDLHTRLQRGVLTCDEALQLAVSVASALSVAHAQNVVHRDIKPANLFLVGGSTANLRVLDFGIARHRPLDTPLQHTATQTGRIVGTIGYMAPEQAAGETAIAPSVDVFALGCVLYECLTGRAAFAGDHAVAVLAKLLCDSVTPMRELRPEISPAFDHLVLSMLNKKPHERPANASALIAELSRVEEPTAGRRSIFAIEAAGATGVHERRYIAFLLIAPPEMASMDKTETSEISVRETEVATEVAARYGASVIALSNRTYLVRVSGFDSATDTARTAADCGLAFVNTAVHRVAVAMAPTVVGAKDIVGVAVDRAAALLAMYKNEPRNLLIIDDVVEGLLDARYVLDRSPRTAVQSVVNALQNPGSKMLVRGTILRSHQRDSEARAVLGQPLPCVGRERELGSLVSLLSECVDESVCRVAVVLGAAGIGKSRLRAEFVKRVRLTHATMYNIYCEGSALGAKVPWETVRSLLRGHAEAQAIEWSLWLNSQETAHQTVLSVLFNTPLTSVDAAARQSLRDNPALLSEHIERMLTELLAQVLASKPCLVAFDDLQFGDLASIQLFESVFRRLKDKPLMVLALGRDELTETFGELWRARGAQVFRLAPLSRRSVEKLFRHVLGTVFDQQNSEEIISRAEGNPLFVEELIRAVAEGHQDESPESLIAMMQSRMDKLSGLERQILYVMSVFFARTTLEMVGTVLSEQPTVLLKGAFETLCAGEWICPETDDRFRFSHGLVRDSAYQSMQEQERIAIHRAVADCLVARHSTPAIVLAEHYRLGGAEEQAAALFAEAAEESASGSDVKTTHAICDTGLALAKDAVVRARLMVAKLSAFWLVGGTALGLPLARDAYSVLKNTSLPQKYIALARWCTCAVDLRLVEQVRIAVECLSKDPEPGLEAEWWIAYGRMGFASEIAGMRDISEKFFDRASQHLAELDDKNARESSALFHFVQGMRSSFYHFEKRVKGYQLRVLHGEREPVIEQLGVLHGLGWSLMQVGQWTDAIAAFERGIHLAEREGYELTRAAWLTRATASLVYKELGRFDEALYHAKASYEWVANITASRLRGAITMYYARVLASIGRLPEAVVIAREAVEAFLGPVPMQAAALATMVELELQFGNVDAAVALSERAIAIATKNHGLEQDELLVHLVRIEALLAHGDRALAVATLENAYTMLAERIAMFTHEPWRRSYIHGLPENVRLLALYQQYAQPISSS